jgi:2-polyprenyl-3-methyl-5-hydroxy-6-metoxy-1,4-benzoquinol methylase
LVWRPPAYHMQAKGAATFNSSVQQIPGHPPASAREILMEWVACPLCGGARHHLVFNRFDHTHQVTSEPFRIVRCQDCRFVFVNPRPDRTEIHNHYPEEFYEVGVSPEALLTEKRDTLQARVALIGKQKPGKLLDVGCQKGEFLEAMRRQGWDVQGVEFSGKPPNLFGVPIFSGTLEQAPFEHESFDLITLWAVLEHVHDPIVVLKRVRALLKPNGRALVLVPNFNSIPGRFLRHDDVPRHLLMFTKKTFREAAAAAGLRVTGWHFGNDIFSGSTRGVLNYILKIASGEAMNAIVAQNRTPGRWPEFAGYLKGRPSGLMLKVDRLDIKLTPWLDRVMDRLHLGFIMTVEMRPFVQ